MFSSLKVDSCYEVPEGHFEPNFWIILHYEVIKCRDPVKLCVHFVLLDPNNDYIATLYELRNSPQQ